MTSLDILWEERLAKQGVSYEFLDPTGTARDLVLIPVAHNIAWDGLENLIVDLAVTACRFVPESEECIRKWIRHHLVFFLVRLIFGRKRCCAHEGCRLGDWVHAWLRGNEAEMFWIDELISTLSPRGKLQTHLVPSSDEGLRQTALPCTACRVPLVSRQLPHPHECTHRISVHFAFDHVSIFNYQSNFRVSISFLGSVIEVGGTHLPVNRKHSNKVIPCRHDVRLPDGRQRS